jgi:transcriptional regulator with XRE-family HTH domain
MAGMDIQQNRINNLRRVISKFSSAAEFGTVTGVSTSYLSQILNKHRNFGEKAARKIEEKAGLKAFSLDAAPELTFDPKNEQRSEQQPDTSNKVKLIQKADIGAYLSGESVKSELLPRELSAIKEYHHGSDRTFSYIEDVASIQSLIIPGETIVMVDPDAGISATGRGRHYLAKINDRYLIGYIEDTASGMMLNFDNRSPGWDAIAITPSDCIGRVLSAFERNWK